MIIIFFDGLVLNGLQQQSQC